VSCPSLRRQPAQREAESEEHGGGVIELASERDDARHEVDRRGEVRRAGDEHRTTGA
jgi:hypothetical protein